MSVTIIVTSTSCGLLGDDDNNSKEFVPLEVGNYWLYHRWYSSPNIADTVREEIIGKHEIEMNGELHTVYGYQHFFLAASQKARPRSSLISTRSDVPHASAPALYNLYKRRASDPEYQWLRANTEEGLVSFGGLSPTDTLILRKVQYRYPGEAGEQQEYPTLSYDFNELQFTIQDTITIEIIGTNETFESEWATWKGCYVYRIPEIGRRDDVMYWWDHFVYIKPGIGIVAVDTRGNGAPEHIIGQWILIDYQLNQ